MDEATRTTESLMHRRMKQVFVLFAIIAAFFLVLEHRAHLFPYLPWLFLLACPLMHLFMHHGHGSHHHGGEDRPSGPTDQQSRAADSLPAGASRHQHGSEQ